MGFEQDAIAMAAQLRAEEDRDRQQRKATATRTTETIQGFIDLLGKSGYVPVPVYAESRYKNGIFGAVQHFERSGSGWLLRIPGEGGGSSFVITSDGKMSHRASLTTPSSQTRVPSKVSYRGLPGRGNSYISCGRLTDPELSYSVSEAINRGAGQMLNGVPQSIPGMGNAL